MAPKNKTYNNYNKHNNIKSIATLLNDGTINESQAEKIVIKQIYLYQTKKLNNLL